MDAGKARYLGIFLHKASESKHFLVEIAIFRKLLTISATFPRWAKMKANRLHHG